LDGVRGCARDTQLHLAIPTLLDPMLGIVAHREGSHQLVPIENQVSQALPAWFSNGT